MGNISRQGNNTLVVNDDRVIINGKDVGYPPVSYSKRRSVSQVNGEIFINGYQYMEGGYWRRTLRGLWN